MTIDLLTLGTFIGYVRYKRADESGFTLRHSGLDNLFTIQELLDVENNEIYVFIIDLHKTSDNVTRNKLWKV